MESAILTGATGFLGFHIAKQLSEQGWSVRALHRAGSQIDDLANLDNVECFAVDFNDNIALKSAFEGGYDACFHIAGDTNLWSKNNAKQDEVNIGLTRRLIDISLETGIGRFIHTSSISAFGFHHSIITETSPSTALSSGVNYLRSKYLGEQQVKEAVKDKGLDAVILNPCAIMGSHDKHNWSQLFALIKQNELPGIPPGEGSYCHVEAVAAAHIQAYRKGKTGENYILAGTDCSFKEVVQKIGNLLNTSVPQRTTPTWVIKLLGWWGSIVAAVSNNEPTMTPEKAKMVTERVVASSQKAIVELDYDATVSIDKMLGDCYQWLIDTKRI